MSKLDIARNMLQMFSLIVFMIQTVTFLQRYQESPTIVTTSQTIWDESYRPRLMVCESKLFNVTRSRQLGYEFYLSYMSGQVSGLHNSISWRGKYNSTWSELESSLFPNINTTETNIKLYKPIKEKIFMLKHLQPFTVCNEIVDYRQIIYISSKRDVLIYLMDPYRFTNQRVNTLSMKGDSIFIPKWNNSDHSSTVVTATVSTNVVEQRTDKGKCKQYQSATDYSMCIENGYINLFKKFLGCVPPWLRQEYPDPAIVCTNQIDFKDETITAKAKAILDDIGADILFRDDSKNEKEWCLPPCKQLIYNVQIASTDKAAYYQNWLNLKFAGDINVETEINGYDSFRLIIEIGSSLGLWLGLCIISIFDMSIEGVLRLQGLVVKMY